MAASPNLDLFAAVTKRLPWVATAARETTSHSLAPTQIFSKFNKTGIDFNPGLDTQGLWSVVGADGVRVYTPQRQELHQAIVDSILSASRAQPSDTPTATFMMGAPASGKSGFVKRMQQTEAEALVIETDKLKDGLPEYRLMLDKDISHASDYVHQEARDIADLLRDTALARRLPVIVDRSGASARYVDTVRHIEAKGYTTKVVGAFVDDTDLLLRRAHERFLRTERQVPENVIREQVNMVARNALDFIEDPRLIDRIEMYDTTSRIPTLIGVRNRTGSLVVHQPDKFRLIQEDALAVKPVRAPAQVQASA